MQIGELDHVRHLQHEPVAWGDAEIEQVEREVGRARVELGVGNAACRIEQRDAVGRGVTPALEHVAQRTVAPIARRAIASSIVLGIRRYAIHHHILS